MYNDGMLRGWPSWRPVGFGSNTRAKGDGNEDDVARVHGVGAFGFGGGFAGLHGAVGMGGGGEWGWDGRAGRGAVGSADSCGHVALRAAAECDEYFAAGANADQDGAAEEARAAGVEGAAG